MRHFKCGKMRQFKSGITLNLHNGRFVDEGRVSGLVGTATHLALVQEVTDRSLTLLKNAGVLPVRTEGLKTIVNINIQKLESDPSPAALGAKLAAAFPGFKSHTLRADMDPAVYERAWKDIPAADLVVLSFFVPRNRLSNAAPLREADLAFIDRVIKAKPRAVIAMSYGNPHLLRKLEAVPAFLVGYGERGWFGNQSVYFDSFVKLLKGEIKPSGKLPVKVSDQYPLGSGLTY
jgi:beta-N-acetylhexosaminidase